MMVIIRPYNAVAIPTKVVNKKFIPKKGGVVLACNHFSNLDVILLQLNIGRGLKYLAKKELMKNKFVGWFLKKLGALTSPKRPE